MLISFCICFFVPYKNSRQSLLEGLLFVPEPPGFTPTHLKRDVLLLGDFTFFETTLNGL